MAFWTDKPLQDMSAMEWESLCDGCGLCCQLSYEDEQTGEIALTCTACAYLDLNTHRCTDYANRHNNVADCVAVTPHNVDELNWLPVTCAYRLVAQGYDLPDWHPLVCGDPQRVHNDGPSMLGELLSEQDDDTT